MKLVSYRQRACAKVSETGASLVEYALLLALIAVICVGAVSVFGTQTDASLDEFNTCFEDTTTCP